MVPQWLTPSPLNQAYCFSFIAHQTSLCIYLSFSLTIHNSRGILQYKILDKLILPLIVSLIQSPKISLKLSYQRWKSICIPGLSGLLFPHPLTTSLSPCSFYKCMSPLSPNLFLALFPSQGSTYLTDFGPLLLQVVDEADTLLQAAQVLQAVLTTMLLQETHIYRMSRQM